MRCLHMIYSMFATAVFDVNIDYVLVRLGGFYGTAACHRLYMFVDSKISNKLVVNVISGYTRLDL